MDVNTMLTAVGIILLIGIIWYGVSELLNRF